MLVLIVIVGALVWSTDGKIRFVVGVILAAVFAAVFILGSMYVYKTHSTLAGISGVNTEVTEVGIYVRADDSADSIEATADYMYGVLTDLDRANSDKAIQEVDSETGKTVQVQEYAGLTELVDGLLNGQTGAIVLNSAYLSVIEEMDGYSDISSRIKELTVKRQRRRLKRVPMTVLYIPSLSVVSTAAAALLQRAEAIPISLLR